MSQATNDKEQLLALVAAFEQQTGQRPNKVLAASGRFLEMNLQALEWESDPEREIVGYIATER